MKEISKKYLDESIRLCKEFYSSHDNDLLSPLNKAEKDTFGKDWLWTSSIITGITTKSYSYDEPNQTYYDVFSVLGFKIVEDDDSAKSLYNETVPPITSSSDK